MRARDIVGKTVARIEQSRVTDGMTNTQRVSVDRIVFTDGSTITFTGNEDDTGAWVEINYHRKPDSREESP